MAICTEFRQFGKHVYYALNVLVKAYFSLLNAGLDVDLPSYHQNDKWAFFFTTRWSIAGVVSTYIGFWDYQKYIDLVRAGVHVTPEFREKYGKFLNWRDIPEKYIPKDYRPPYRIKTPEEHMSTLNKLGFTRRDEISHVISKFETGLADPLNFPLMAEDLSNLPPAYVLACEYDTLRDDALLYAQRLENAGNEVVLDYQRHGWHGHMFFAKTLLTTSSPIYVYENVTKFINDIVLEDSHV